MSHTDNPSTNSWERIQTGVRDTERLIGQKRYNMAMVKARQTLEFMVKSLCERSGIAEGNLIDMIDALYENELISRTTCEHYHKIRTIGNKAIHEEDNSAYNANQAHHLLSQEVYTFANDYTEKRRKPAPQRRPVQAAAGRSAARGSSSRVSSRTYSRRRRARSSGFSVDPGSVIKPLLVVAIIIVLIFIIKMVKPDKDPAKESSSAVSTESTAAPTEVMTTEAPTEAPTETEPVVVKYKTKTSVNLRQSPDTDHPPIILLGPDVELDYLRDHDAQWAVISYNGQEAYISKEFITPVS